MRQKFIDASKLALFVASITILWSPIWIHIQFEKPEKELKYFQAKKSKKRTNLCNTYFASWGIVINCEFWKSGLMFMRNWFSFLNSKMICPNTESSKPMVISMVLSFIVNTFCICLCMVTVAHLKNWWKIDELKIRKH